MKAELSNHFQLRKPSAIRMAQIKFAERTDDVKAINTAIGNVSLPMHPAMQKRMFNLNNENSPFKNGVVKYSATSGFDEANNAVLNIIASSGFKTEGLYSQITNGGSQAMELFIIGVCGAAGTDNSPLLLIDAAYTNYTALAKRIGRKTVSITRHLQENGKFTLPSLEEIENSIKTNNPGAIVVIPYDNPTGHFYNHKSLVDLARLCVKYNLWLISDEAYRELHYVDHSTVSIWGLTDEEIPGIEGRRISIETSSKVWNACGLRIGALVTDNEEFHHKAIAEHTADLCPSVIGQYIFGALAHETHDDLQEWYKKQRVYYWAMLQELTKEMKEVLPNIIISSPDASIYSVVDVRNIVDENFDAVKFVEYCATQGKINVDGEDYTLLVSPMAGFYNVKENNPGRTQMRIAYVAKPGQMKLVPKLFKELLEQYLN